MVNEIQRWIWNRLPANIAGDYMAVQADSASLI